MSGTGKLASNLKYYKVFSKHPYYQYLSKYDADTIRYYQTDYYVLMGRSSMYNELTRYYANAHISLEEEHSLKHKTPLWYLNTAYPSLLFVTGMIIWANLFYLGDQGKIFNRKTHDLATRPCSDLEAVPSRYEHTYIIDRPRRW